MWKFLKSLYLTQRFFYIVFGFSSLFLASFWGNAIFPVVWLGVLAFGLTLLTDIGLLYSGNGIKAKRFFTDKFSNGDENPVEIHLQNRYRYPVHLELIDEIPPQFQKRDFLMEIPLKAGEQIETEYFLKPVERGAYRFGGLNVYVCSKIGLAKRRYYFNEDGDFKVYPSIIQMKKYDFLAIDQRIGQIGLKRIRRIGHTMEFERIKEYVRGDDIRTINWKATAKTGALMVNQYQDEKAQPVYSVINVGRQMKMPFEGLKLLDYAINSSLAFSNIALKKGDKVGMLTYAQKVDDFVPANNRKVQLTRLLETLYAIDTQFLDTDLGLLYAQLRRKVSRRSLLFLYTNFEHYNALKRQLPYLKAINKKHLLVVIFFENTELKTLVENPVEDLAGIYDQVIATRFKNEKYRMRNELRKNGIQAILTPPAELTVNTINKYLELKSRGLL